MDLQVFYVTSEGSWPSSVLLYSRLCVSPDVSGSEVAVALAVALAVAGVVVAVAAVFVPQREGCRQLDGQSQPALIY